MEYKKLIQYTEYLFTGFFFTGIFIFFAFFYNSHLHFAEQVQLFLMTDDYFLGKVSYPGGFAGYTGEFLTQFYFLSLAGPLIISVLLFAIRQMTKSILERINPEAIIFPLSFLPALGGALILCDEFYPLSAVTGILIALLAARLYINISYGNTRFISGLLLILVIYWLAGGSYLMLLAIMIVYELILNLKLRREISKGKNTDRNIKSVYGMKV